MRFRGRRSLLHRTLPLRSRRIGRGFRIDHVSCFRVLLGLGFFHPLLQPPHRPCFLNHSAFATHYHDIIEITRRAVTETAVLRHFGQHREPILEAAPSGDKPLLNHRIDALGNPVDNRTGGKTPTEEDHHERHEIHHGVHHGLLGIRDLSLICGPHHLGLNELKNTGQNREDVIGVSLGQTLQPHETIGPEFRSAGRSIALREVKNRAVEPEEDRNLDEHGETTGHWIDLILAVEPHRLLGDLLTILPVLLLEFFDLWLKFLHRLAGADGLHRQRQQHRLDKNGKDDDRETGAAECLRQKVERVLEQLDVVVPNGNGGDGRQHALDLT